MRFFFTLLFTGVAVAATLPVGNLTCTYTDIGSARTCTPPLYSTAAGADASHVALPNGITGVDFWLGNSGNSLSSYDTSTNGSTTSNLTFTTSGLASGPTVNAGTVIPFIWDFDLALNLNGIYGNGFGSLAGNWTVTFDLKTTGGGISVFGSTPTFSGPNAASILGGGSAVTTSAILSGTSYTLTAKLSDTWTRSAGSPALVVTVPQGSLDFNAVPEPATVLPVGAIGLLLAFAQKRFKLRRSS